MSKMLTVMKREYLTRIKTKGFIISTFALPLLILAMLFVPAILAVVSTDDQQKIAVIDLTDKVYQKLDEALSDTAATGERLYLFEQIKTTAAGVAREKDRLREEITSGDLTGLMIIPSTVFEDNKVEYYAKNVSNFTQNREMRNVITSVVQEIRILERGISPELVDELTKRVNFETFRVGKEGEQKDMGQTFILAFVLVMFLYITLVVYGATVMQAVTEEKSTRVVELIISSVKPFQLMAGKIFGIGSVGLTQFLIWSLSAALLSAYASAIVGAFNSSPAAADVALPQLSPEILVYFVLYFILGYILFATLYAAVGAIVNSQEEAQQMQFPVIMLLIIPLILMQFVIRNPNATSSVVLSFIPFFKPILFFTRIVVDTPPFGEILLSFAVLILSITLMIYLVGKIFRVGILMYGKRPTLPEVLRWIRY